MHDVYAYGVIAPSTLVELRDEFPSPAGYAEVAHVYPSIGGEAAGSAYVLARLGVAVKLQGNHLRADDSTARVLRTMSEVGVDCSALVVDADARPIHEIVIAHGNERTIFGSYARLLAERAWAEPSRDDIATARIVCVDPFFGEQSLLVSRWCRDTATPYVTIDATPDSETARHATVVIVSQEYARRAFDSDDPQHLLGSYTEQSDALVILTRGHEELWYGRAAGEPSTFAPFAVPVHDSTGAGDSFRAGVIDGLLRGLDDEALIRSAAAVSAIVCRRPPGVLHSPTVDELDDFLRAVT